MWCMCAKWLSSNNVLSMNQSHVWVNLHKHSKNNWVKGGAIRPTEINIIFQSYLRIILLISIDSLTVGAINIEV